MVQSLKVNTANTNRMLLPSAARSLLGIKKSGALFYQLMVMR